MVETLMLRNRSPPVPQVSTTSMPVGRSSGTAWVTIARTNPVISATDSPLARRAVASAAICDGAALPDSTSPRTDLGLLCRERPPGQQLGQHARPCRRARRSRVLSQASVGHGQSHHRSWPSTPLAMSPSCTWEVPSTMVSWRASRYHCSVGWSSM